MVSSIDKAFRQTNIQSLFHDITIGQVVDTNDPQQMGRVRATCPALGDSLIQQIKHVPWATYAAPFAGYAMISTRGRDNTKSKGPISYGMWAIPKIGSYVLIACIDGDPSYRVWFACIPGQFLPHTMPHGRYSVKHDDGQPSGPLTSTEQKIQPLYDNQTTAFTGANSSPRQCYEYKTRGADNQVANLSVEEIQNRVKYSKLADDRDENISLSDGTIYKSHQGYRKSRIFPNVSDKNTDGVLYDSQLYSLTTPGFHGISMDDSAESCRIRLRTTGGHQIILDDTNERIYISTAKGHNWIELDEHGSMDVYCDQDISVKSKKDINFTSDQTIRMYAKQGIHMFSDEQIRLFGKQDINIQTDQSIRCNSDKEIRLQSIDKMHVKSGSTLNIESSSTMDIKSGGAYSNQAGGNITIDAPNIALNGGGSASSAKPSEHKQSFLTSRVPDHEPWGRSYMKKLADQDMNNKQQVEYPYDDKNIGRGSNERGQPIQRNLLWRR